MAHTAVIDKILREAGIKGIVSSGTGDGVTRIRVTYSYEIALTEWEVNSVNDDQLRQMVIIQLSRAQESCLGRLYAQYRALRGTF